MPPSSRLHPPSIPARSYFNTLRIRYWAPQSRPYHMQAWAAMRAPADPLLSRIPALQRYLDVPIRWFQSMGEQQAHAQ